MARRQTAVGYAPKGKKRHTYTCDQCGESEDWWEIPPMWTLILNLGLGHSDPGFEHHLCQPGCLTAFLIKTFLTSVPG